MKFNHNEITSASKKGICGLLAYYIELSCNPKDIESNDMLDFGSFYEQRERAYGLSWSDLALMIKILFYWTKNH